MTRTLILNISAQAQTLPAAYGGFTVSVGHGRVVSDESSVVVTGLGGFEAMDGKWAVSAISTDTALGDIDVAANGVAMLATFVPGGGGGGGPVAWGSVTDKPTFSTVATSGSYDDLIDKPALADVATSGDYADLTNKPTLPAASNTTPNAVSATGAAGVGSTYSRGDHQHAHGNQNGGTLHSVATTLSAGFMAAADKSKLDGLAAVAESGDYADLSGTPSLAAVATSGAYADLSGTPSKTYDMATYINGTLAVGATVMKVYAPKALTLTGLNQGGGATVKVQINGSDASYPQSVSVGQVISAVVTVGGVDSYLTISAVEA